MWKAVVIEEGVGHGAASCERVQYDAGRVGRGGRRMACGVHGVRC